MPACVGFQLVSGFLSEVLSVFGKAVSEIRLVSAAEQLDQFVCVLLGDRPYLVGTGPDIASVFLLTEVAGSDSGGKRIGDREPGDDAAAFILARDPLRK